MEIATMLTSQRNDVGPMPGASQPKWNEDAAARRVADEVSYGNAQGAGGALLFEYEQMTHPDRANLTKFVNKVVADNALDRKADPNLPGLEIQTGWLGDLKVYRTEPSQTFGNSWRKKEEMFADLVSENPLDTQVGGHAAAIAENNSSVVAIDNARVLAMPGSHVMALDQADVFADKGAHVETHGRSTVEHEAGAYINTPHLPFPGL
jgi:hypothetical protein